jgi:hypothetical protein
MLNCCVGCLSHELFGSASNIRDRTTADIRAAIHPKALSRGSDSEKDGQVLALLRPRAIIEWNEIKKEGIGLSNLAIASHCSLAYSAFLLSLPAHCSSRRNEAPERFETICSPSARFCGGTVAFSP